MDQLLTVLLNNGIGVACAGAVLWFAWHRETHTIPNLTKAFTDSQKVFTDAITDLQDKFEQRNVKIMEVFTELVREERQNYERWHTENRERLDKLLGELKENRHYTRDLANQIGLRHAVELERTKARAMAGQQPPHDSG